MFLFCNTMIFSGDCSAGPRPYNGSAKSRFKAILQKRENWLWIRLSAFFLDLCAWRATKSGAYVVPKTKYMTLGPKFYNFGVLSPRIFFCFVNPCFFAEIAAQDLDNKMAVSNHDFKPSGTFF